LTLNLIVVYLNSGIAIFGQLAGQEGVQLRLEDTTGNKLKRDGKKKHVTFNPQISDASFAKIT